GADLEPRAAAGDVEAARGADGLGEGGIETDLDVHPAASAAGDEAIGLGDGAVDVDTGVLAKVLVDGGREAAIDGLDGDEGLGAVLAGVEVEVAAADGRLNAGGVGDLVDGEGDSADGG